MRSRHGAGGAAWLANSGPRKATFRITHFLRKDVNEQNWSIAEDADPAHRTGQIVYRPYKGPSKNQLNAEETGQGYRIVTPIKQIAEDRSVYDLTRCLFEEMLFFPFGSHDDLVDALSRIYDFKPVAAEKVESDMLEPPEDNG
jgi:hypothetical protein